MAFNQLVIAVSGTHKSHTQGTPIRSQSPPSDARNRLLTPPTAKLEKLIRTNGGSFAKAIDENVTHLVTTQVDFDKGSAKGTWLLPCLFNCYMG